MLVRFLSTRSDASLSPPPQNDGLGPAHFMDGILRLRLPPIRKRDGGSCRCRRTSTPSVMLAHPVTYPGIQDT